jgi:hypothetical protein
MQIDASGFLPRRPEVRRHGLSQNIHDFRTAEFGSAVNLHPIAGAEIDNLFSSPVFD